MADRSALVDAAIDSWTRQLIDLSARNRLLYYRPLKLGTIDFADAERPAALEAIDSLRSGRSVRLGTLYPVREHRIDIARRLRAINAKAVENFEERGLRTLYLAWGLATWATPSSSPAVPAAPMLLFPLRCTRRDAIGEDFDLVVDGEVELNPTFMHVLATQFKIVLDADALVDGVWPEDVLAPDGPALFRQLATACADIDGFAIAPSSVVGNFSFAKLAMVRDIDANREPIARHDLIAAIAGDSSAQLAVRSLTPDVPIDLPDRTPPAAEYVVLPADASQHHVINRALAGESLVVQGPPGTGKSQTIANLIGALVAGGKSVLFVAEKRAAIDAVVKRLAGVGLEDVVLDLHSSAISKRAVAQALRDALDSARTVSAADFTPLHRGLEAERAALVAHEHTMHAPREPWGLSLYAIQSELCGIDPRAGSGISLPPSVLSAIPADAVDALMAAAREHAGLRAVPSAWAGAQLATADDASRLYQAAQEAALMLPQTLAALEAVCAAAALQAPATLPDWAAFVALLAEVEDVLTDYDAELFTRDLPSLAGALHPGVENPASRLAKSLLSGGYRRAKKDAEARLRQGVTRSAGDLARDAAHAADLQRRWSAVAAQADSRPTVPAGFAEARASFDRLTQAFAAVTATLPGFTLDGLTSADAQARLDGLRADSVGAFRQPRLREIEVMVTGAGMSSVLTFATAQQLEPELAAQSVREAWLRSIYQGIAATELGAFDGAVHTQRVARFQQADEQHQQATVTRVMRAVGERATTVRNRFPDESQLVENQAARKRGHLPVRELVRRAPNVLTALKPCWTMSPLLCAQLLPSDRAYFDVVIFDEASQVTPADAMPALLRAPQAVIAGDGRQLPPTAFFATETTGDAEESGDVSSGLELTSGFESVLDVAGALLRPASLTWHYRSRDERLIAFSNAYIYEDRLVTFPGVAGRQCLHHDLVPTGVDEADRVVALVLDHARTRPHESLGVIALGIQHAERIEAALRSVLAARPDRDALAPFFAESRDEGFFVKNLERVQGDERDAIILSVGYGKSADGRLLYRFGPINNAGGERRLNVAITRARSRLTLVSSFSNLDMDPEHSTAEGVRLLRRYLAYAATGGSDLGEKAHPLVALDAFEAHAQEQLVKLALPVTAHYGVSGYRIDFALAHPARPERMVLAVEVDGPSYHAARTSRERDRLRQEVLERLGWRFHRSWSTAWFRDPAAEAERVAGVWRAAVAGIDAAADRDGSVTPAAVPDEPDIPPPPPALRNGRKPVPGDGRAIGEYSDRELIALIAWIRSDTLLRTDDELLDEAVKQLGYKRRGPRIVERVQRAIDATQPKG